LRAIGGRLLEGDADALAFSRTIALEPGRAGPLIAALAQHDADWVAEHAEDIVRQSPDAAAPLLIGLQGSRHDIGALGAKLAPLAGGDFREYVERFIGDDEQKRRILAALG
jgi:hypothetical protein